MNIFINLKTYYSYEIRNDSSIHKRFLFYLIDGTLRKTKIC